MFEYKRNQYISIITTFCHIVVAGSFLLCFHYTVVSLDIFVADMENGHTRLEELVRLELILVGMLEKHKKDFSYEK